jgi:hypothetical protein
MITKFLLSPVIILLFSQLAFAQDDNQTKSNCDCEGCHQFDFWIGEWKAEWKDKDGNINEGSNIVNKILDGCVIEENFDGNPAMDFKGKSFSVYNHNHNTWQQTWVDNEGYYMLFSGGMNDDKMILSRKVETTDGPLIQRMIFHNIKKDSFDWDWESSTDNGKSWKLNWKINYLRLK